MRTTVRLNEDLLRRLKAFAAERNRSMTSVLEDAVRQLLDRQEPVPSVRHIDMITFGGDGYVVDVELTPEAMKHVTMQEDIARFKQVSDAVS